MLWLRKNTGCICKTAKQYPINNLRKNNDRIALSADFFDYSKKKSSLENCFRIRSGDIIAAEQNSVIIVFNDFAGEGYFI